MSTGITVAVDPWHLVGAASEPAFQNSWTNFGGVYHTCAFRKYPSGRVGLTGMIKGGAHNTVVFTLPVGYRPPSTLAFAAVATGGISYVYVAADGTVIAQNTGSSNITTSLDIAGIEFDTESVNSYASGYFGPLPPALVTQLPANPSDGDEVYFANPGLPTWHLRFNLAFHNADGYGWEYVGGAPYHNFVATSSTATILTLGVPTPTGPTLTAPLSGTYFVDIGAEISNSAAGSGGAMSYSIGAAAALEGDRVIAYSTVATAPVTGMNRRTKTLVAGDVLDGKIRAAVSGTATIAQRWMSLTPRRLKR
jgi:hypothetical protein